VAWQCEHSADSSASPQDVWQRYVDVENWKEWSKGVEESSIDGDFEAGTKGTSKSPNLPRAKFELLEVESERRFTSQAKMPGGALVLEHEIERTEGGSRITHRATLDGPLTFVWTPVVGRIVKRELPPGVERLAELAVEKKEEERKDAERDREREERLKGADEKFKEEIERTSKGEADAGGASLPGSAGG
jgi:hypothetical protein